MITFSRTYRFEIGNPKQEEFTPPTNGSGMELLLAIEFNPFADPFNFACSSFHLKFENLHGRHGHLIQKSLSLFPRRYLYSHGHFLHPGVRDAG